MRGQERNWISQHQRSAFTKTFRNFALACWIRASFKTKYNINVSKLENGTVCKFDFTRNTRIQIYYDLFTSFDSVTIEEIRSLFVAWFMEMFVYSNYAMFNNRVEINVSVSAFIPCPLS